MPKPVRDGEKVEIVSFTLTPGLVAWLRQQARLHGKPMSSIVRGALRMFAESKDESRWEKCR